MSHEFVSCRQKWPGLCIAYNLILRRIARLYPVVSASCPSVEQRAFDHTEDFHGGRHGESNESLMLFHPFLV